MEIGGVPLEEVLHMSALKVYMKVMFIASGREGFGGVLTQQSTACEDVWQHSSESRLHNFHVLL